MIASSGFGARAPVLVLREAPPRVAWASARDVALRILRERYGAPDAVRDADDGGLFAFQKEAVDRGLAILARRGGVLIADSVGLGKTFVARALLRAALPPSGRALVVGPAALRTHWQPVLASLPSADWSSFARLSRRPDARDEYDVVVFDEAHALRNPATRRYRAAAHLCRGARVVLLSATPVNNSLWDLYHLLRLFVTDRGFADVGVPSLRAAFEDAEPACLLGDAAALQPVLRAVMIRRTRPVLSRSGAPDHPAMGFPERRPPVPVHYSLGPPELLEHIGRSLQELRFPAHSREDRDRGRAAAGTEAAALALMRVGLFKRLESSTHAFRASLRAYDALLARCLDGLARGLLVRARDDAFAAADGDQLRLTELLYQPVPAHMDVRVRRARLERERSLVAAICARLGPVEDDPKLDVLLDLLRGDLRDRRVLVFTQFRDTARHVHRSLLRHARVALIDGAGALLGSAAAPRLAVVQRFAPGASGVAAPPPHEAVDVLVATDVLSEGFNLQDADVVVSYDLPWNPIRLVQRLGRIDRLGSPHRAVFGYHFLPGDLEGYLGLLARLARKTAAIEASIGSDLPTLHDELLRGIRRGESDSIRRMESRDAEWFELDERLRALLKQHAGPALMPDDDVFLAGIVRAEGPVASGRSDDTISGLVAARVGHAFHWVAIREGRAVEDERLCGRIVTRALCADGDAVPGGRAKMLAGNAVPASRLERLLDVARGALARRTAAASTAALLPGSGAAARLGRRVLGAAAALPGGPDAATCARVERCLATLAALRDAGAARLLSVRACGAGSSGLADLLAEIERIESESGTRSGSLADSSPAPGVRGQFSEMPVRLVAALLEVTCED